MIAEQLNTIVTEDEDGLRTCPDYWKDSTAFLESLRSFLAAQAENIENRKAEKIKPGKDGILTVEDVIGENMAG